MLLADKLFYRRWHRASVMNSERELLISSKPVPNRCWASCLGMQLLGRRSEGTTASICWASSKEDVPGNDRLWSATATYGLEPRVYPQAGNRLFQGIEDGAYFYFVRYAMPVNPWTIAQCNYGEPFTAAVQKITSTACSSTRGFWCRWRQLLKTYGSDDYSGIRFNRRHRGASPSGDYGKQRDYGNDPLPRFGLRCAKVPKCCIWWI